MILAKLVNATATQSTQRTSTRIVFSIVVVALLLRGFVCLHNVQQYSADPDAYQAIAETLARSGVLGLTLRSGETVPTAFRPPLYPFALSWLIVDDVVSAYAVALFHTLLGCLTVLCTYLASSRLLGDSRLPGESASRRGSILAAGLVVVDPILLQQSTLVMTETLATAIASIIVWWWVRRCAAFSIGSAVLLAALLALAFLCRPTFLVWAGMLALGMVIAKPSSPSERVGLSGTERTATLGRGQVGRALLVAAIIAATVLTWTIRNRNVIGYPVWATTHGGYTLLLGNNPMFYDYLSEGETGTTWDAEPFLIAYSHRYDADPTTQAFWETEWNGPGDLMASGATADLTEHDDDQLAYRAAKATIKREPKMFVWSCIVRVYRLWTPLPHRTKDRSWVTVAAIGLYYTVFYMAVLVGLWKLGRQIFRLPWWPILSLILTLTLVHAVYWSNLRMRAPAIPSLAIIAAAAMGRREEVQS